MKNGVGEEQGSNTSTELRGDPKRLGRILFGVLFLAIFIGYYMVGNNLDDGTLARPGPGMVPGWVGVAGAAISVIVIIEALVGRSESGTIDYPRGRDLKDVIVFIGLVIAYYAVLIPLLGQYISSILFAVVFIRIVGRVSWVRSLIIGSAMGLILTAFFSEILGIPLPSGTLIP